MLLYGEKVEVQDLAADWERERLRSEEPAMQPGLFLPRIPRRTVICPLFWTKVPSIVQKGGHS